MASSVRVKRHAVREHSDFPVSFSEFAKAAKGTDEEVWTKFMKSTHSTRKMLFPEWRDTLASIKSDDTDSGEK